MNSLIDNLEAHYPRQQAKNLQSKLWISNIFGQQHPPEHLGSNLKDDLCHQPFIRRIKHAEFWVRPSQRPRNSPVATGDFGGLSPETKVQDPKLEM